MQAYCPYCGQKIIIDVDNLDKIYEEREISNRIRMEYEYQERKDIREEKQKISFIIFLTCLCIIAVMFCIYVARREENTHMKNNEIEVSISSEEFSEKTISEAKNILKTDGFKNIKLIESNNFVMNLISEEGKVKSVSINGDDEFMSSEWFPQNAEIEIVYYK